MMATRWTFGASCLSISSDFPTMEYSRKLKPVMLPPGRAKFGIKPCPTGSLTKTKMIGMERVASRSAASAAVPFPISTSGASATNSAVYSRMRSASPAAQRYSIRRLRPSTQPRSVDLAGTQQYAPAPLDRPQLRPLARRPAACAGAAARPAKGHNAPPPRSVMNWRRLIRSTRRQLRAVSEEFPGPVSWRS